MTAKRQRLTNGTVAIRRKHKQRSMITFHLDARFLGVSSKLRRATEEAGTIKATCSLCGSGFRRPGVGAVPRPKRTC